MTLQETAKHLVRQGKGILAADESTGTCNKRFESLGIPATEEMRRAYRELLFTMPGGEEFLSRLILFLLRYSLCCPSSADAARSVCLNLSGCKCGGQPVKFD